MKKKYNKPKLYYLFLNKHQRINYKYAQIHSHQKPTHVSRQQTIALNLRTDKMTLGAYLKTG